VGIQELPLAGLEILATNSRFMEADQFEQLVTNLKRDGVLTSAPL